MDAINATSRPAQRPSPLEARVRELERQLATLEVERERERQYLAQLEAVIDTAPLAIYLKDADHNYLLVNRAYEQLSAQKRSDILGKEDFALFPPPVAQLFRDQDAQVVSEGRPVEFRETIPLPGRGALVHHLEVPAAHAPAEASSGWPGSARRSPRWSRRSSSWRRAQADLVKKERLGHPGRAGRGGGPRGAQPHRGHLQRAGHAQARGGRPTSQGRVMIDVIGEESERLNRMVTALLELARPEQARLAPTPVMELVRSSIDAARSMVEPEAEVRLLVPEPLPLARVDEHKVHQALVNLISNAVQATGRQGPVQVRVTVERDGNPVLRVDVIDDGDGVPPELRERVFAPFFTARAKGTGLGLAVVRRVAEAHRGTATIEATPGGGATFVLKLPL